MNLGLMLIAFSCSYPAWYVILFPTAVPVVEPVRHNEKKSVVVQTLCSMVLLPVRMIGTDISQTSALDTIGAASNLRIKQSTQMLYIESCISRVSVLRRLNGCSFASCMSGGGPYKVLSGKELRRIAHRRNLGLQQYLGLTNSISIAFV